ncbi:MAG: DUF4129 domain-containing protein [Sphingobacteriales bacterium]|nr:DUF4129 domain-containing protein [Sphingobacteriales bacterium]
MPLLTTIKMIASKLKLFCLLAVLLLWVNKVLLADTVSVSVKDYQLELRDFDAKKMDAYKADRNFIYDRTPPGQTPWEKFWRWLMSKLDNWFSDSRAGHVFNNYIKYILIAAVVLLIIRLLLKADIGALFFRAPKGRKSLEHEVLDENIHEMDFEMLIEQAISGHDYRKAVRLYYLKTLKQLSDKGLLDWQINKTNYDYQLELAKTPHAQPFQQLTLLFDYVWYGEMGVDKTQFGEIRDNFVQFQRKV